MAERDLPRRLNAALLECPSLVEELPQILAALDGDEGVQIDLIRDDSKRKHLLSIFACLPLQRNNEWGWHKLSPASIRDSVIGMLLSEGSVKQPKAMSHAEQIASRSAPLVLLELLKSFPSLLSELPSLFDQILDGNRVQLDDLPNEELADRLRHFLKSLGLNETQSGIGIPEGSSGDIVEDTTDCFVAIFEDYRKHQKKAMKEDRKEKSKRSHTAESRNSESDDGSGSDSERSTASQEKSVPVVVDRSNNSNNNSNSSSAARAVQGPARPSAEQLSATYTNEYQEYSDAEENEDEDEDDAFGPRVAAAEAARSLARSQEIQATAYVQQLPLGYTDTSSSSNVLQSRTAMLHSRKRPREEEEAADATADKPAEREEWLMTPGEGKTALEMFGAGSAASQQQGRRFQSGKQAKKAAEALSIQREFRRQTEQTAGGVVEDVVPKAPSLMEEHLMRRLQQGSGGKTERKAFDRDRDILQRRKLGTDEVQSLVEKARDMHSRFDAPVVQKNFL